jgi:hypothetical protein
VAVSFDPVIVPVPGHGAVAVDDQLAEAKSCLDTLFGTLSLPTLKIMMAYRLLTRIVFKTRNAKLFAWRFRYANSFSNSIFRLK